MFWKALADVPPLEVLAHRTVWSFAFFVCVIIAQGRLRELGALFTQAPIRNRILIAAIMITVNWGVYITSIQVGRTVEASLGYFIFPLVAVVFGALFFNERLARLQLIAVAIAAVAVAGLTLWLGVPPLIALTLATTFGIYGMIKKSLDVGPVLSGTAEVAVLMPIGLLFLLSVHGFGFGQEAGFTKAAFGGTWRETLLLILAGPLTGLPLIMFSYGARRVALGTLGLVQYVNPSLQFLVAVLVFREPLLFGYGVAFALIWVALGLYSKSSLDQEKALSKAD